MLSRLLLVSVCVLSLGKKVSAQDATVFLRHPQKTGEAKPSIQLSYQLPGEDEAIRHAGIPTLMPIPQGGSACFRVERANPLLYTYSVGSKIVKVETPDTVSQVLRQLLALAPKAAIPGVGLLPDDRVSTADQTAVYAGTVGQLFRIRTEMESLKVSSDSASNLVALANEGITLANAAADTSTAADKEYASLPDATKKDMTVRMLRAGQLDQTDKAKRLAQEFASVEALLGQRLCAAPLGKERMHVTLSIAAKPGIGTDNLKKVTGDELASFDVEPISNAAIEFGPGLILNRLDRKGKEFALSEGKITESEGDDLLFRPSVFANFRSWGPKWIWGTVGVSGDKDGISDLFVGGTGRFGYSVAGARLAVGVGLAATRLATGLTKGAVGQPLPADITSLEKIVKKKLLPGLGIVLMATGF